jgi:glucose-6-phosphate dehydrogenase assembly protein OpcA
MAETTPTFAQGIAVEIGRIERELKKLWEQDAGATTRASLMNLAIYCEGLDAMGMNTALISDITQSHACRAILIVTEPDAPQDRVQAWISAHCHMSRAGAKQVCCEQITFLLEGQSCGLIPNIVFSHLDSDLPLYLWWQSEFSAQMDEQLWTWVDRLIFDSHSWSNPREQFALLRDSLAKTKPPRLILCDLNWTRLIDWRQALAELFDSPSSLAQLSQIEGAVIFHGPGHCATALLLVGWIMAQLGWKIQQNDRNGFTFAKTGGADPVRFDIHEAGTHAIERLQLWSKSAQFQISYESGSVFLHEEIRLADGHEYHHLVPPGKDNLPDLFNEELMRGGKHKVYLRALEAAESLFEVKGI